MEKTYTIVIKAKPKHQPTQAQVMDAIRNLVKERTKEFPEDFSGFSVNLFPRRLPVK